MSTAWRSENRKCKREIILIYPGKGLHACIREGVNDTITEGVKEDCSGKPKVDCTPLRVHDWVRNVLLYVRVSNFWFW